MNLYDIQKYSWFANLAYVPWDNSTRSGSRESIAAAANAERAPVSLGTKIFDTLGWTIAPDPQQNDAAGFAANLFVNGGQKVLAIRGTEPDGYQLVADLLQADVADIGTYGLSLHQATSLFNYVQRLRASAGATNVLQLALQQSTMLPGFPPPTGLPYVAHEIRTPGGLLLKTDYFWFEANYTGTGLGQLSAGDTIVATGHSLGGHLAALALRMFPELFAEAYTFNAPGFDPLLSKALTDEIVDLFGQWKAAGASSGGWVSQAVAPTWNGVAARIHTIESESSHPGDDWSAVSSGATGMAPSPTTFIATEQNSHSMDQIMDALAVQALIQRLAPSMSYADIVRLYEASGALAGKTDEAIANALSKLLLNDATPVAEGEASGNLISPADFTSRISLHDRVITIDSKITATPGLMLVALTSPSRDTLVSKAQQTDAEGLAYRYALKELNLFAVIGADYSSFNANGELDLYDPVIGDGNLTELYLQDRAAFLTWRNKINTDDLTGDVAPRYQDGSWYFKDEASGIQAWVGNPISVKSDPMLRQVKFGGDGADILTGGDNGDQLYGGGGDDVLTAGAGDDLLVGGRGGDFLLGNDPTDTWSDAHFMSVDADWGITREVSTRGDALRGYCQGQWRKAA